MASALRSGQRLPYAVGMFQIARDTLVTDAESITHDLVRYGEAVRVMGNLEQIGDTVAYKEFVVDPNGKWRGANLRSMMAGLPVEIDWVFPSANNALPRVRIYKSGRRRYAAWQKMLMAVCALAALALLYWLAIK
jgi:hypothetical protein